MHADPTVYQYCPDSICMFIDRRVCCGKNAYRPSNAPMSVTVDTGVFLPNEQGQGGAWLEAGFPEYNYWDKKTFPTCYWFFGWPASALKLKFTEDFALVDFSTGKSKDFR